MMTSAAPIRARHTYPRRYLVLLLLWRETSQPQGMRGTGGSRPAGGTELPLARRHASLLASKPITRPESVFQTDVEHLSGCSTRTSRSEASHRTSQQLRIEERRLLHALSIEATGRGLSGSVVTGCVKRWICARRCGSSQWYLDCMANGQQASK